MGRPRLLSGEYGHESYTRGVLRLLEHYGPFRLAFFEALFRAADSRASRTLSLNAKRGGDSGLSPGMELREEPSAYHATGSLSPAEQSLVAELVADGLSIQDKFRPEPRYKQTGKGHFESKTVEEIQQAKETKAKGKRS
jgi:hypothetical protein